MIHLTRQERSVLLFVCVFLFLGSTCRYAFKKYPRLRDISGFMQSDRSYFRLDINTADYDELVAVPYIGNYTARRILDYRQEKGRINSLEEIRQLSGIREKNFAVFSKYLKVSGRE